MTALHPFRVADAAATAKLDPVTLEALVKGTLFVLGVSDTLGNITQGSGQIALAVAWAKTGLIYYYDSTDTTTADDGATCLVDASGHRYKLEDSASIKVSSVLSLTNTPAVSPSVGDAYVVGTVPTGVWVGFANDIAIYTRRGWVFAVPEIGTTVLNQATNLNIQFNDSSAWAAFAGSNSDASVRPRSFEWPMGLAVESTTNTPPGSPTVGLYYICGAAPTGAWSGQAGKVATYYNSAWEFMSPYTGASVFNRALGYELYYVSGSWTGPTLSQVQTFSTAGSTTWTKPSFGTMAHIETWGAGGSGGKGNNGTGSGGAGGGYDDLWIPLASLGATETVVVGAGGPAQSTNSSNGTAGGNSTFGSWLTGYGGAAGPGSSVGTTSQGAGGGGGIEGAGAAAVTTTGGNGGLGAGAQAGGVGGAAGTDGGSSSINGGGGGGGGAANGGSSDRGGGGGGGSGKSGVNGGNGGKSHRGGGGGGGACTGATPGTGGASKFGGAGGNGGTNSGGQQAGAQPGGGGGGADNGAVSSGKGGDGRIRVTVF